MRWSGPRISSNITATCCNAIMDGQRQPAAYDMEEGMPTDCRLAKQTITHSWVCGDDPTLAACKLSTIICPEHDEL